MPPLSNYPDIQGFSGIKKGYPDISPDTLKERWRYYENYILVILLHNVRVADTNASRDVATSSEDSSGTV